MYSKHLYVLINSVWSLNRRFVLTEEAVNVNKLIFLKDLTRLRFEGSIWPPMEVILIRMALDAHLDGGGGHYARCPGVYPGIILE